MLKVDSFSFSDPWTSNPHLLAHSEETTEIWLPRSKNARIRSVFPVFELKTGKIKVSSLVALLSLAEQTTCYCFENILQNLPDTACNPGVHSDLRHNASQPIASTRPQSLAQ